MNSIDRKLLELWAAAIRRYAFVGLTCAALAGCRTSGPAFVAPDLPAGFPNHTQTEIEDAVGLHAKAISSLETRSRMRFETPEESQSVNLDILYRRDDSLLVKAKVTLGIEVMRSLVTPDSFYVYDRLHKRLYRGPVDQAFRLLPTPGPLQELFESLAGALEIDRGINWHVSHDSLYYYLASADQTMSLTVDPRLWRVVGKEDRTPAGDLIERQSFTDFDSFGQFVVPRRIEVYRPLEGERFQVYHRAVTVNPTPLSFEFKTGAIDEEILVAARD